jgi:hypothetical protein
MKRYGVKKIFNSIWKITRSSMGTAAVPMEILM